MQIQQRQHLADLRRAAAPGWQDRRGKPLTLNAFRIHTAVVDPRRGHGHRAGGGHDLPLRVVAVAHHQPPAVLVDLVGEPVDISRDLGSRRRSEHLPRTLAHDLIDRRTRHRTRRAVRIGLGAAVITLSMGRTFPPGVGAPSRSKPVVFQIIREGNPSRSSTGFDHCSQVHEAVVKALRQRLWWV